MSLKIEKLDGERWREGHGKMAYRCLTVEQPKVGVQRSDWHRMEITVYEDGCIAFDVFTGWHEEWDDSLDTSLMVLKDDAPDAIMAIQEFLGSL